MQTITETYNIYTIDELEEANKDGYNKAIQEEINFLQEDFFNFTFDYDYRPIIEKIEEIFGVTNSAWSCDGYNASYFVRDCAGEEIDTFKRTYSYVQNTILPQIKNFEYSLTGFYADCEPLAILKDFVNGKKIFTSVKSLINAMCLAVLECANNELQTISEDTAYIEEEIHINEYTYLIDGTMRNN